jgi:FkbM family methyltransferase
MVAPAAMSDSFERLTAKPLRIFDVGARGGLHERWNGLEAFVEMVGFEPDQEECERLNQGSADHERYLPHAVGAHRGTVRFHVAAWPVASSIYPPDPAFLERFENGEMLQTVGIREIETTTLDDVCKERGIWPDLLKLDVEGAELDALHGGPRAAAGALAIDVEVAFAPLRPQAPSFGDVDAWIQGLGFSLGGLKRVFWKERSGDIHRPVLIQGDALYIADEALASPDPLVRAKLELIIRVYAPEISHHHVAWDDANFLGG